ncbi:mitochondrial carrier domain-containing protein [Hyaloraphidium curvatum]|nr:mitochondrial carrier domain-containing protein [Hyaloraphidium curvatum]
MSTRASDALPPRLSLSACAAAAAELATYPVDAFKTRRQLAGPPRTGHLYAGVSAAVLRHLPYTSVRVAMFESLKRWHASRTGSDGRPPLPALLAFGFVSGAAGQAVAVPLDLAKIRMVADPRANPTLGAALRTAVGAGPRGLFRGGLPAVQRAAIVNLGELATYDAAKARVVPLAGGDNLAAHVGAAICSGLVSSLLSTPADVVKTRLMAQDPSNPRYVGAWDCLWRTWGEEGLRGLYRGFWPTWARLGPWQLCFWVSYERLRGWAGMAGF